MFEISVAQAGTVDVVTTTNGGLSVDHWADRATEKIISVGDKNHPEIVEQAKFYRDNIRYVIKVYMEEAIKSSRTDIIAELERNGYEDVASILRKM
jgi:hypothetical protein